MSVVSGFSGGSYSVFNSPTSNSDWSAAEQLHGQDCAITPAPTPAPPRRRSGRRRDRRLSNFDDHGRRLSARRRDPGRRRTPSPTPPSSPDTHRNLPPVSETTELSFCFGSCYPTDGSCTPAPTPAPTASPTPAPTPTNYNLTFYLNASSIISGTIYYTFLIGYSVFFPSPAGRGSTTRQTLSPTTGRGFENN